MVLSIFLVFLLPRRRSYRFVRIHAEEREFAKVMLLPEKASFVLREHLGAIGQPERCLSARELPRLVLNGHMLVSEPQVLDRLHEVGFHVQQVIRVGSDPRAALQDGWEA